MTPIKANDLIPELALELGMDEKIVRGIVNHYWNLVQDQLDKGDKFKVYVSKLGTFTGLIKPIERIILKESKLLNLRRLDNKDQYEIVGRLERLKLDHDIQMKNFYEARATRRAIKHGTARTMEEPEIDC